MNLSSEEQLQYQRHLSLEEIGISGQQKLKDASVLVIGAGGLGCPVLQYLAAAGVGTIGIIDDDQVDQTNLQRQILYTTNDIGKHKAVVAKTKLLGINPYIKVDTYLDRLTNLNALELFDQYDIIVDGSDNFSTRYLVNDAACIANKPVVFGSILSFEGQASVFNYKNGPTYRCLFPAPPSPEDSPSCVEAGVLGVLTGIIGCIQANETIKLICGIGTILSGKLLTFEALSLNFSILTFNKNSDQYIHELLDNYDYFCGITANISEISMNEFLSSKTDYVLIDVRTRKEYKTHNIGGINIPLAELSKRVHEVPVSQKIVMTCQSGARSKTAIQLLTNENPSLDLVNLKGGLRSL